MVRRISATIYLVALKSKLCAGAHPLCFVAVHHVFELRRRPTAVQLGRDDAGRGLGSGFGEVLALFYLEREVEPTQGLPLLVEGQLRRLLAVRS